jgi:glutathione S-transferase
MWWWQPATAMSLPILYSFRRCPYAMRARMALAVSAVGHIVREVSLKTKPAAMLSVSPKGTVPVLVLADDRVIDESLDIMLWALEQNDPERWLIPTKETMKEMMALVAINDGPFKFHLDRMKYANRFPGSENVEHRLEGIKLLTALEGRLSHSTYLFGDMPSLVDIAIFPFVRQFAHADLDAFAREPLPYLQRWLTRWESSSLFESAMIKQAVWQPNDESMQI